MKITSDEKNFKCLLSVLGNGMTLFAQIGAGAEEQGRSHGYLSITNGSSNGSLILFIIE